jgi:hypothetical protein
VFIKLGPKHASKDEIELAVFEVIGEFRLGVRDLELLVAVVSWVDRLLGLIKNLGRHTCLSEPPFRHNVLIFMRVV